MIPRSTEKKFKSFAEAKKIEFLQSLSSFLFHLIEHYFKPPASRSQKKWSEWDMGLEIQKNLRTFLFLISVYQQSPFFNSDRKVNLIGMKMSMRYQDCVLIAHTLNVLRGQRYSTCIWRIIQWHNNSTPQQPNQPFTFIVA